MLATKEIARAEERCVSLGWAEPTFLGLSNAGLRATLRGREPIVRYSLFHSSEFLFFSRARMMMGSCFSRPLIFAHSFRAAGMDLALG